MMKMSHDALLMNTHCVHTSHKVHKSRKAGDNYMQEPCDFS